MKSLIIGILYSNNFYHSLAVVNVLVIVRLVQFQISRICGFG